MKLTTILFAALITLFLGGCESVGGGAPQAAIDAAFGVVKKGGQCEGYELNPQMQRAKIKPPECKDFSVAFATKRDITPADKENGISEHYEIGVDFLITEYNNHEKWLDGYQCTRVLKQNGSYSANAMWTEPRLKEQKKCNTIN